MKRDNIIQFPGPKKEDFDEPTHEELDLLISVIEFNKKVQSLNDRHDDFKERMIKLKDELAEMDEEYDVMKSKLRFYRFSIICLLVFFIGLLFSMNASASTQEEFEIARKKVLEHRELKAIKKAAEKLKLPVQTVYSKLDRVDRGGKIVRHGFISGSPGVCEVKISLELRDTIKTMTCINDLSVTYYPL